MKEATSSGADPVPAENEFMDAVQSSTRKNKSLVRSESQKISICSGLGVEVWVWSGNTSFHGPQGLYLKVLWGVTEEGKA